MYHQKNDIVTSTMIYRLIKILDKPPAVMLSQLSFRSWNIFHQFKLILMIYGSFASLYNVPSTLMCVKT